MTRKLWAPPPDYVQIDKTLVESLYGIPMPIGRWGRTGAWPTWLRGRDAYAKIFLRAIVRCRQVNEVRVYVPATAVAAFEAVRNATHEKTCSSLIRAATERGAKEGETFLAALRTVIAALPWDSDQVQRSLAILEAFVRPHVATEILAAIDAL